MCVRIECVCVFCVCFVCVLCVHCKFVLLFAWTAYFLRHGVPISTFVLMYLHNMYALYSHECVHATMCEFFLFCMYYVLMHIQGKHNYLTLIFIVA